MKFPRFALWLLVATVLVFSSQGMAQQAQGEKHLQVATRLVPPFAMKEGDQMRGFSVELWQAVARQLGWRFEWQERGAIADLLGSVERREADLAIAAISITSQREEKFDFSQPMFEAGLQILVRAEGGSGAFSLAALTNIFTTGPMPGLMLLLALLILVPAHIVWLIERRHPGSIVAKAYFPGIFQAIWWATGASLGQQLTHPQSPVGRAIAALGIFVSVIFLSYFTANVTTALTVQQLRGDIDGPEDLPGRKVATVTGSTAAQYLRSNGIAALENANIAEAIRALHDRRAEAVVFDAPVLLYHAATEGRNRAQVVGPIFRREAYGILFPQGSTLRKPVNEALLKLREDGSYDAIYRKWFARDDKAN